MRRASCRKRHVAARHCTICWSGCGCQSRRAKEPNMPIKHSLAARVGIEMLRNRFPAPKPAWNSGRSESDYSVGGALCGELCVELGYATGDPPLFPGDDLLAEAMCQSNNNLPKQEALAFAHEVNQKNED